MSKLWKEDQRPTVCFSLRGVVRWVLTSSRRRRASRGVVSPPSVWLACRIIPVASLGPRQAADLYMTGDSAYGIDQRGRSVERSQVT